MVTEADIEVFSPLSDLDILEACRVVGIKGRCDICGQSAVDGLHCTECCHGTYCSGHCPVCTGRVMLSEDEWDAMRRNRDAQGRFEPDQSRARASGHDGRGRWPGRTESCSRLPPDAQLVPVGTKVRLSRRRKHIYSLIEHGMLVAEFFDRCHQAGLPQARQNLRVLVMVYGAVQITRTADNY